MLFFPIPLLTSCLTLLNSCHRTHYYNTEQHLTPHLSALNPMSRSGRVMDKQEKNRTADNSWGTPAVESIDLGEVCLDNHPRA
jgi:hypothetical protein